MRRRFLVAALAGSALAYTTAPCWMRKRRRSSVATMSQTIDKAESSSSSWSSASSSDKHVNGLRRERQASIDVFSTLPEDIQSWSAARPQTHTIDLSRRPPVADPFALVADDLAPFVDDIKKQVDSRNPILSTAAKHFFETAQGKRFRPTVVALLSRALPPAVRTDNATEAALVAERQRQLGQITEMIHVASLIHDDVLDDADTRRGGDAIHKMFSNKVAVLSGDYLLARASVMLARLANMEVVEVMAKALDSLVSGEIMQIKTTQAAAKKKGDADELSKLRTREVKPTLYARAQRAFQLSSSHFKNYGIAAPQLGSLPKSDDDAHDEEMQLYLRKSYYKTASLICDACKSTALLAGYDFESSIASASEEFGYHLGLAFQIIDDVLDFAENSEDLGKPAGADLSLGLATAPILYAAQEFPELRPLIDRRFKGAGDVTKAYNLVRQSSGLRLATKLAHFHAQSAVNALCKAAPPSPARDALVSLCYVVLTRKK
ncbi:hypothetical protein CTAYLR_004720 [Chrysophaeum taylorii]|uniref:Uncharacterized protein n=1 Tax=Chrysophaeum taylorii TaxID=2483200 RepID=A0AAD7U7I0_9STRA|nr:hypothetical protein CTAYLR_004720 [Chrysophaeum taylorii]